jgi:hypothetical protein
MIKKRSQIGRGLIGLTVLLALLFAGVVSVAPQWHKRLHHAQNHECAATLISSGNCDQVSASVFVVPSSSGCVTALLLRESTLFLPALEFLPLEHAPPALS